MLIEGCGVAEEKAEKLAEAFEESFGAGAQITPKNIIDHKKFNLETPEVTIKVDPEHKDLVTTQIINDTKYIMIKATSGVLVNGISISFDEN